LEELQGFEGEQTMNQELFKEVSDKVEELYWNTANIELKVKVVEVFRALLKLIEVESDAVHDRISDIKTDMLFGPGND
jgi:hypothetical protein